MERAVPQYAVMGDPNARFDPLALTWLGSLSSYRNDSYMLLITSSHKAKTIDDLRQPGVIARLGASQQGSANLTMTQVAKYVLGINIEPISGYSGTSKIAVAIQSGEVDGEMIGMSSLMSTQRHLWDSKFLRPLAQFARETRHPALPDVPTARELVKDPDKLALLEFAELSFFMARPFVGPAGIPPDRAKALRDAFMAATADPEYIAESEKLEIDHSPIDHVEIERLLRKAVATPKSVIAEFDRLVNRK
jgi:tripartite-type tricarboxylate transporter receptor subunit TctC